MAEGGPATKRDIDALREDLRTLIGDVRVEIGGAEARLREEIGGVETRLREEIGGVETRLREEVRENEVKVTKRMDDFAASLEEQIRDSHTEVLRAMLTTQEGNLPRF